MKPGVLYLQKMMNFNETRGLLPSKNDEFHENAHFFFYKKLPLFIKNCPLLFIKNLMLQIVIYKKLNFWEEYTSLKLAQIKSSKNWWFSPIHTLYIETKTKFQGNVVFLFSKFHFKQEVHTRCAPKYEDHMNSFANDKQLFS